MVEKNFDIKQLQDVVASWAYKTKILEDQTRFETFGKLEEETQEVRTELVSMDKEKLALEIADVIFTCCLLAVQSGINLEEAIVDQLDKQFDRYNPYKAEILIKEGKNGKEVLKELKNNWTQTFREKQIKKLTNIE
jgi:phosphoribosyl-ATP pyrophosphohydrolase